MGERRGRGRRLAVSLAFAALFVSGAALTAWAGDQTGQLIDPQAAEPFRHHALAGDLDATTDTAPVDPAEAPAAVPAEAPPAEPAPTDEQPAPRAASGLQLVNLRDDDAPPAPVAPVAEAPDAPAQPAPAVIADRAAPAPPAPAAPTHRRVVLRASQARLARVVRAPQAEPDPETTAPGTVSVVWVNRPTLDPTPPARRLERSFARILHGAAGNAWPLTLGLLRAEGADGPVPADSSTVQAFAARLSEQKSRGRNDWEAVAAISGDPTVADRAIALAHFDRAVGLETLITGLEASKARLARKVLADPRISVYADGRDDLAAGRVNVRVTAVIAYLAETFGSVEVSSLVTGHRLFARPRVISAHVYGEALDVAALGGTPILGHQEPGGVTEKAVRALLLLPAEAEPRQIISLLGLGGPSFPLADHADHIHVGF